jgi:toxin FitB
MSRAILDTSVLIGGVRPEVEYDEVAISVVSVAELHFGVLVASTEQSRADRLQRLLLIQRRFDALPVDEAVAESYGRLAAQVAAVGRAPRRRSFDLLIAATAHAHDAALLSGNPDDFTGLEELVTVVAVTA